MRETANRGAKIAAWIGGYHERYILTYPPTPVEDFSGSLYIGKGFNLQADWQNNDHFRENLTNQHYQTTICYPALGTTLFCEAEIRF